MSQNPVAGVLIKWGDVHKQKVIDGRQMQRDTGRRWPSTSQRERRGVAPCLKGTDPADTLTLHFQPPKL